MSREVRVFRDKVFLYGETKRRLLSFAEGLDLTPTEAFNLAIDRGYERWLAERQIEPEQRATPETPRVRDDLGDAP